MPVTKDERRRRLASDSHRDRRSASSPTAVRRAGPASDAGRPGSFPEADQRGAVRDDRGQHPPAAAPARRRAGASPAGPARARAPALASAAWSIAIVIVVMRSSRCRKTGQFLDRRQRCSASLRSMSTIAIMALGLTLVIVVGEIDLSFGAPVRARRERSSPCSGSSDGCAGLPRDRRWPSGSAHPRRLFNAFLVTVVKIPSFIATLGHAHLDLRVHALHLATRRRSTPPTRRRARPCPKRAGRLLLRPVATSTCRSAVPDAGPLDGRARRRLRVPAQPLAVRLPAQGDRRQPARPRLARLPVAQVQVHRLHHLRACWRAWPAMLDFSFIGSASRTTASRTLFPVFAAVIIGGASLSGGRGTRHRHALRRAAARGPAQRPRARWPGPFAAADPARHRDDRRRRARPVHERTRQDAA